MSKINYQKVLIGGIIAGFVINAGESVLNIVLLGEQSEAAMERLGLAPQGSGAMAIYIFMGFALGLLLVWLYAAIRPRFGPGPRTALMAGVGGWALFSGLNSLNVLAMGAWPAGLIVIGVAWALVELCVAALVGARFYNEPES